VVVLTTSRYVPIFQRRNFIDRLERSRVCGLRKVSHKLPGRATRKAHLARVLTAAASGVGTVKRRQRGACFRGVRRSSGQAAELFALFDGYQYIVADAPLPVALLDIKADASGSGLSERSEPIYGGYAKGRGEIVLFGKDLAYRVDFKNQTLQQRPQLNSGAQARYDATEAGEPFEYCNKTFRRLSGEQIVEICASGRFRVTSRQI
jgi:hypothetical protein